MHMNAAHGFCLDSTANRNEFHCDASFAYNCNYYDDDDYGDVDDCVAHDDEYSLCLRETRKTCLTTMRIGNNKIFAAF